MSTRKKIVLSASFAVVCLGVGGAIKYYTERSDNGIGFKISSVDFSSLKPLQKRIRKEASSLSKSAHRVFVSIVNEENIATASKYGTKMLVSAGSTIGNPKYRETVLVAFSYLTLRLMSMSNIDSMKVLGDRIVAALSRLASKKTFYPEACLEELTEEKIRKYTKGLECVRTKERARAVEMLEQRRDNFFVTLVGESGAGKSVLLYQIAQKLMDKDVTVFRLNVDILRDMSRFEDRLEQRVSSLAAYCGSIAVESDRRVVLILDEMATLHDPKEEGNSLNNYFKMYLELVLHKGFTFQILGATTHHELETFYDADFAMKRRMREISLPRLSQDELVNILKKQAGSYCQQNDIAKILAHLTQVNYPAELQLSEAKRLINEGKSTRVPLEDVLTLYHPLPEDADFISTADGSINLDGDSNLDESASRFMYQGGSMPHFPGGGGTPLFPFATQLIGNGRGKPASIRRTAAFREKDTL